ncbi:MAG: transcriptional regulator GcvA [Pseudomonadota bacterium]
MVNRRLPPLNALRAFESAARLLSFKKAAEELHVTPAAISQQVKTLEDALGQKLFRRLPRALILTETGQRALPHLSAGFERLARGVEQMSSASGVLTVSVAPSFGGRWLVPRLGRFRDIHPEIEVRVDASERVVDLDRDDVDLAIRFGSGDYPGMACDTLFRETASPVCAPSLITAERPLAVPEDLRHHTLLQQWRATEQEVSPTWGMWMKAAGVEGVDSEAGPRFSDFAMTVMAALAAQGVALSPRALVEAELADGRLIAPFDDIDGATGEFSYFLVIPEARLRVPKVRAFRTWILAEVAAYAESMTA